MSDVHYIGAACRLARKYFRVVGLEVYPMDSSDYAYLHQCGADFVTVFQETYAPDKYGQLHLGGRKRIFPYRFNAQERALQGGMRGVGFAALLGLDDFRRDALATGLHAYLLQRKYPQAEIDLPLFIGESSLISTVHLSAPANRISPHCRPALYPDFIGHHKTRQQADTKPTDKIVGIGSISL